MNVITEPTLGCVPISNCPAGIGISFVSGTVLPGLSPFPTRCSCNIWSGRAEGPEFRFVEEQPHPGEPGAPPEEHLEVSSCGAVVVASKDEAENPVPTANKPTRHRTRMAILSRLVDDCVTGASGSCPLATGFSFAPLAILDSAYGSVKRIVDHVSQSLFQESRLGRCILIPSEGAPHGQRARQLPRAPASTRFLCPGRLAARRVDLGLKPGTEVIES